MAKTVFFLAVTAAYFLGTAGHTMFPDEHDHVSVTICCPHLREKETKTPARGTL